jgi:hypothetical protein
MRVNMILRYLCFIFFLQTIIIHIESCRHLVVNTLILSHLFIVTVSFWRSSAYGYLWYGTKQIWYGTGSYFLYGIENILM